MTVKAAFAIGEAQRLLLPTSALAQRGELDGVYVIGTGSQIRLRQLRLGHRFGDKVEVLPGLTASETIATDPAAAAAYLARLHAAGDIPMSPSRLGFSGRIARAFQDIALTPILALAALLLGIAAMLITPREEEPQIDVTMANVTVPFPGADVHDVENLVALSTGAEACGNPGRQACLLVSRPGMAVLTVEFQVGVPRQTAIVRLYNQVFQNQDFVPRSLGVGAPLVRPMGIDDVPVMALTLWSDDPAQGPSQLAEVAHTLETELKRIPGTRDVYTIGAPERAVVVELDATKLAGVRHRRSAIWPLRSRPPMW